jgi:hypothetical protein
MGVAGLTMGFCSFWSDYTCADARHFSPALRQRAFGLDLLAIYSYLSGLFLVLAVRAGLFQACVMLFGMNAGKAIVLEWSGNAANPAQWEVRRRTHTHAAHPPGQSFLFRTVCRYALARRARLSPL